MGAESVTWNSPSGDSEPETVTSDRTYTTKHGSKAKRKPGGKSALAGAGPDYMTPDKIRTITRPKASTHAIRIEDVHHELADDLLRY